MLVVQLAAFRWLFSRLLALSPSSSTCPLAKVSLVVEAIECRFKFSDFQLVHVLWRLRQHSPLLGVVHKCRSMVGQDLLPLLLVNRILEVNVSISLVVLAHAATLGVTRGTWRGNVSRFATLV